MLPQPIKSHKELEERSLYDYLYKGYLCHNNLTFFKGKYREPYHDVNDFLTKEKETDLTVEEAIEQIEKNITDYLKGVVEKYKKPVLLGGAGFDSNLIKKIYEKNFGPLITITHSFHGTPYDEYKLLKEKEKLAEINYVVRSYDDVLSDLSSYIGYARQPISGLPTIGIMKAQKFAKNLGADIVLSGVEDAIWFSSTLDCLDMKMKSAGDFKELKKTDFLTEDFKKRVKTEDLALNFKSKIKKHIFEQFLIYKSPKVIYDFMVAGKVNNIAQGFPYLDPKNINLVLSLKDEVIHFDGQPKSLIAKLLEKIDGKPFRPGLEVMSPQRELIKTLYRNSIVQLINESYLVRDGFVDKEKLLNMFNDYCNQAELGNSFFIWKFITAEIWYSIYFYGIKKDLYPIFND